MRPRRQKTNGRLMSQQVMVRHSATTEMFSNNKEISNA